MVKSKNDEEVETEKKKESSFKSYLFGLIHELLKYYTCSYLKYLILEILFHFQLIYYAMQDSVFSYNF